MLQEVGSEVELKLTTKNVMVEISCLSTNSSEPFTASFDVNDVPDNNSLSTQLETVSESGAIGQTHVKATYDTIDGLLESKGVELSEVEGDIKRIAEELRGASMKQSAPAKAKKGNKSQQQVKQREEEQELVAGFGADDTESAEGSILQTISSGLFSGLGVIMQHKAVVAFGLATYAIFAHGDVVSV
ncbi:unnamed protein product [Symbiodinium microadriaticum]|nr:unnamed protein product [Symbiodinium microadriaticum]